MKSTSTAAELLEDPSCLVESIVSKGIEGTEGLQTHCSAVGRSKKGKEGLITTLGD